MKEFYYYLRDKQRAPRITVCIVENGGMYFRGVALASMMEKSVVKEKGRRLACARALAAIMAGKSILPLRWHRNIVDVLTALNMKERPFDFKGEWDHQLNNFEQKIVGYL